MKRCLIGLGIFLASLAATYFFGVPVLKRLVKQEIARQVQSFIREGTIEIGDISGSLDRRQILIRDVRIDDRSGHPVIQIDKIQLTVHHGEIWDGVEFLLHSSRLAASVQVFMPRFEIHENCLDDLKRLIRTEAFYEESRLDVDSLVVSDGRIALDMPSALVEPETLTIEMTAVPERNIGWWINAVSHGPRTDFQSAFVLMTAESQPLVPPGAYVDLSTSNSVAFAPPDSSGPDLPVLRVHLTSVDTNPISEIAWDVTMGGRQFDATVKGARPAFDSEPAVALDRIEFTYGDEILVGFDNRIKARNRRMWITASRWIRRSTGLSLSDVDVSADASSAEIFGRIEGYPVRASCSWGGRPGVMLVGVKADTISTDVIFRELGETFPLTGFVGIEASAVFGETSAGQAAWQMNIRSPDLRAGPAFGKLSFRADLRAHGVDTRVDDVSGTIEPAAGVTVSIRGRTEGREFTGRASMRDQSLKDIQLLAQSFGNEFPLSGDSGHAAMDVDFRMTPELELFLNGRLRISGATLRAPGQPFRIDGLDADIPIERSPDTGRMVLDEIPSGTIRAGRVTIGPYQIRDFQVTTKSHGDKMYADIAPLHVFGGTIEAKALFYFSDAPHEVDLTIDSVSLKQVLAPIPKARRSISGLVHGGAQVSIRGTDLKSLSGKLWVKATEGPGELMIVSRPFLENIGGDVIHKLNLPKEVPYERGRLRIHFEEGRIWFDEVTLEAKTLLRRIRTGKVIGSYRVRDLIDEITSVSSENVKVEIGGKKRK